MIDWLHTHKTLLITMIILLCGGISGVIVLAREEKEEKENLISDVVTIEEETENFEEVTEPQEKLSNEEKIKVDIKGAVKNPNVYEVTKESRILDLIQLAGGTTTHAFTNNINLSKKVKDEMVVYIYTKEEYEAKIICKGINENEGEITENIINKDSVIEPEKEETIEKKVNLNQATKEELETIPNIGSAKAEKIIAYRTEKNGFTSLEELKEISGIGEVLYEKIKGYFYL